MLYICWLEAIRLGSSCETQSILIEMVQIIKKTQIKHSKNDNAGKG